MIEREERETHIHTERQIARERVGWGVGEWGDVEKDRETIKTKGLREKERQTDTERNIVQRIFPNLNYLDSHGPALLCCAVIAVIAVNSTGNLPQPSRSPLHTMCSQVHVSGAYNYYPSPAS